jgi:hypothetical protein
MVAPVNQSMRVSPLLMALFFGVAFCLCSGQEARAQTSGKRGSDAGKEPQKDRSKTPAKTAGGQTARGAKAAGGASEPSAAYQESLRQTVERRRQRRARRQQNAGDSAAAVGAIVPWPMPPALIIRHTPEVHGQVDSFLYGLRR